MKTEQVNNFSYLEFLYACSDQETFIDNAQLGKLFDHFDDNSSGSVDLNAFVTKFDSEHITSM